jgi:hypothetical protein
VGAGTYKITYEDGGEVHINLDQIASVEGKPGGEWTVYMAAAKGDDCMVISVSERAAREIIRLLN